MKIITLILMACASCEAAQTNFFPVLSVGTNVFRNATIKKITPVDGLITSEAGWNKVAFSNLAPEIQKQLGYDPDKAAREVVDNAKREKARRALEYQRALGEQQADAAASEKASVVKVTAILADKGFFECDTDEGTILIRSFPESTKQYFQVVLKMQADIDSLNERIDADDIAARKASAVSATEAEGSPDYVDAVMNQRARANLMIENVNTENAQLTKQISALTAFKIKNAGLVFLKAYPSGKKYGNEEIWNCLGIAPQKMVADK